MISLSEVLHTIAQALLIPCLIILLILMAGAVWQIGDIVVEFIAERRKHKCDVPQLLRDVHTAGADGLAELIENSGLLRRQKKALLELPAGNGGGAERPHHLRYRHDRQVGPHVRPAGYTDTPGSRHCGAGTGRHGDAVGVHERGVRHHYRGRYQRGCGQRYLPHPQALVQRRYGVAGNADGGSSGGGHDRC